MLENLLGVFLICSPFSEAIEYAARWVWTKPGPRPMGQPMGYPMGYRMGYPPNFIFFSIKIELKLKHFLIKKLTHKLINLFVMLSSRNTRNKKKHKETRQKSQPNYAMKPNYVFIRSPPFF